MGSGTKTLFFPGVCYFTELHKPLTNNFSNLDVVTNDGPELYIFGKKQTYAEGNNLIEIILFRNPYAMDGHRSIIYFALINDIQILLQINYLKIIIRVYPQNLAINVIYVLSLE